MNQSDKDIRAMCLEYACGLKKPGGENEHYTEDEIIKIAEAFYNFVMNEGPAKPTLTVIRESNARKRIDKPIQFKDTI